MPFYDHNAHYSELLLRTVPPGCQAALDIGCGTGSLAREIASRTGGTVLGLDVDPAIVEGARRATSDPRVQFAVTDFMSFRPERAFGFVCAVASIHHMPFAVALEKMAALLEPGGVLAILGCYRQAGVVDVAVAGVAVPVNTFYSLRRHSPRSEAAIRQPEMSLHEIRSASRRVLPDARLQRLLLWRYLLTWTAPG